MFLTWSETKAKNNMFFFSMLFMFHFKGSEVDG